MNTRLLLLILALLPGCSKGVPGKSKAASAAPKFKVPDNLREIGGLTEKYKNSIASFIEIVGSKASIAGTFETAHFSPFEGEMKIVVSNGLKGRKRAEIGCYFRSTDILNRCLPGQQVVIEGAICDKDFALGPGLEDCKLLHVDGNPSSESLDQSDLDRGRKFKFLDHHGILTAVVRNVVVSEEDDGNDVFVDLATDPPKCIHFLVYNYPDAEKIKSLKPGTRIRVLGTTTKPATRADYQGDIVLSKCQLLQ